MASSFPARKIPAMFARRQPRVVSASKRFASTTQTQNPAYPLYPSVTQLLHEKGIPDSEIPKIQASGPKGRLLKGDVLAYLGSIPADYPASQASRLEKLAHLDLSNIKIAPAPAPKAPKAAAPKVEEAAPAPPPTTSVALSISLATVLSVQKKIKDGLGVTVPLSTFLARATDLANEDLPRSSTEKASADELFNEILGAAPITTSRGDYIPEFNAVELQAQSQAQPKKPIKEDIIDFLSGNVSKESSTSGVPESAHAEEPASNVFSLTIPVGEEKRARTFLGRIESLLTIEPGRLVL